MNFDFLETTALNGMLDAFEQCTSQVVERQATSAGFFTVIKCEKSILPFSQESERTWQFSHPDLIDGGFFVCWPLSEVEICLEAVSNSGHWPLEVKVIPPPESRLR
ncbi:hypothetical protein F3J44_14230 [Pantoea sp. Tr-811]|uniref:hypothetical protein n=1 Tax=unclassified Pantoea TaxID=2630326 RepID=UPI00141E71C1|nr:MULTISPECIES: hypothetical protein [unclassified Pantoea]NIE73511.1 hypothetical protein [Pantoea sp. Ap-967]NIF27523.1 hypothetical protein [Pantoea sp. Tr-811]